MSFSSEPSRLDLDLTGGAMSFMGSRFRLGLGALLCRKFGVMETEGRPQRPEGDHDNKQE